MPAGTVARVYAVTLLRMSEQEDAVQPVSEGIELLAATIQADARFERFLAAPQIAADAKRGLLHTAFEGRLHPIVVRFLDLVVERHREPLLLEIAAAWRESLDRQANRQSATVTTAAPSDPAILDRLKSALQKATGKTIALRELIDPSLLGGMVVRTGDLVMDASLKTRLSNLRRKLRTAGRAY